MSDRTDEIKDKIIQLLKKERREMFTKEIADNLSPKMSPATTSKYLEILRAEGKVIRSDEKKPFANWRLKDNDSGKTN